ncbi:MAG: glutamate--cysteine ligase [Candidatus Omnitrophica bacterium]|nr:glutamate--cysteine ligase [Candidatus Omnitrophota bacterium]
MPVSDFSGSLCVTCVNSKQQEIFNWLKEYERIWTPFYTSVDIRDAGFKIAVVDTNLFPAGFNNLCEHGIVDAERLVQNAVNKRVNGAKNILIVAEEHTRNTWYLENVRVLEEIIQKAGFNVKIATFLTVQPAFCEDAATNVELETATGKTVKIHCFKRILNRIKSGEEKVDFILLNNDLTAGIPDVLKETNIPIFPSAHAGWHSRHKSEHFRYTNALMEEFAKIVNLDPWLFSCLYETVENVDINNDADRKRLAASAEKLFTDIGNKYKEHGIQEKPFVFLKADSGTYGMGVLAVESPSEILELNRKQRNNLHKGKNAQPITRLLLQEGVPTIHRIEENPSEVCIYQIDNNLVGGFYRFHTGKNPRESLNSPGGMGFKKICPHSNKYGDCNPHPNMNIFDIYRMLARIGGVATSCEIKSLENKAK